MNTTDSPAMIAWMVLLTGTFAILACTFFWAVNTMRPVRARAKVTGRAAFPYRYSPTRRQDELEDTRV